MFDIIGQMLPNTETEEVDELFEKLGLPTFEDVANDPSSTFEKLFGRKMDKYDSDADCITITHDAHSRKGFAMGAVLAAEYTADHSGLLTISDMFKF